MLYRLIHAMDYSKNNSVKIPGKRLQCTGLHILFNLCSLLTSVACECCLVSGSPNCDCTPSLTPREHIRRTEDEVNRNPTIDVSYITTMPVAHWVENCTLYVLCLYVSYMSSLACYILFIYS